MKSTIISCLAGRPALLRPGGVPRAAIEAVLGEKLAEASGGTIRAPGMLAAHYAPHARLRLDATALEPGEAGLDFGGRFAAGAHVLDLSPKGDLTEAAAHLFGYLRALDAHHAAIAVAPIPEQGLGEAINDRLRRGGGALKHLPGIQNILRVERLFQRAHQIERNRVFDAGKERRVSYWPMPCSAEIEP